MQEIGFLCAQGRGRDILWEILNWTVLDPTVTRVL